jgi:hypothetical protein
MILRRFQIIYKLFTVFPNSVERPDESHDLPKNKSIRRNQTAGISPKYLCWKKNGASGYSIREIYQRIYTLGIHLCIDQIIFIYRGHSKHTMKFKNKSIKKEYKNWALAVHSYIWN